MMKIEFGIVGGIMGVSYGVEGMIGNLPFHCLRVRKRRREIERGEREIFHSIFRELIFTPFF